MKTAEGAEDTEACLFVSLRPQRTLRFFIRYSNDFGSDLLTGDLVSSSETN